MPAAPTISRAAKGRSMRGKTMKRRMIASLASAVALAVPMSVAPIAPAAAQGTVAPSQTVVLSIGRGELVRVPGQMTDVFVANNEIADVQVQSQSQLYVFGRAGGETTVYASNAMGDVIWSANVRVGSNIDSVGQMLGLALPEARIAVSTVGANTVLLTGTVGAPEHAAEAERLVQAFVGEETNVVTSLRTATPLQVNLQVRIAEVSRSLLREIGANLLSQDSTDGFQFGVGQGRGFANTIRQGGTLGVGTEVTDTIIQPSLTPGEPGEYIDVPGTAVTAIENGTSLFGSGQLLGRTILGALDLGERTGLVTTLSQPNLTALSGETASFLAGGEFPIPVSEGLGQTSIEYRKYGVSLSYTPVVLSNGRISMRVRPEVSELSSQGAVTLNGFQVPGLTIRRAETTVELGSGQSIMIAGLMSSNALSQLERAPGLADMPIIGNLFRSQEFRRGETELVIIVTPYLVRPVNSVNDIHMPTDGFRTATTAQQMLLYQESDGETGAQRPGPRAVESTVPGGPGVSNLTPAAPQPGQQQPGQQSGQSAEARRVEDLPTPGFSMN